jgi:hypothetical protein
MESTTRDTVFDRLGVQPEVNQLGLGDHAVLALCERPNAAARGLST